MGDPQDINGVDPYCPMPWFAATVWLAIMKYYLLVSITLIPSVIGLYTSFTKSGNLKASQDGLVGPRSMETREETPQLLMNDEVDAEALISQRGYRLKARATPGDSTPNDVNTPPGEGPKGPRYKSATIKEIMQVLTPEEKVAFTAAQQANNNYLSAKKAEKKGRELTPQQAEALKSGNSKVAVFRKMRREGTEKLIAMGKARPEVVADRQARIERIKEFGKTVSKDRRRVSHTRSMAKARGRIRDREMELQALIQNEKATEQDLQELASIEAKRERQTDQRRRYNSDQPERRRANYRARKDAEKMLKTRIDDETASEDDLQKWARIQGEAAKAKAKTEDLKAKRADLETKVKSETADEDELREWAKVEEIRNRKNARNMARYYLKKGEKGAEQQEEVTEQETTSIEEELAADSSHDIDSTRHESNNGQPLQFSSSSSSSSPSVMSLFPKFRTDLGGALRDGWQAITTGTHTGSDGIHALPTTGNRGFFRSRLPIRLGRFGFAG